jgi:hypothetical protein
MYDHDSWRGVRAVWACKEVVVIHNRGWWGVWVVLTRLLVTVSL